MPVSGSSAIANVLMGPLSFVLEADNVLRNVLKSSSSGSLVTASVTWSLSDLSLCFELLKKGELLFASEDPRTVHGSGSVRRTCALIFCELLRVTGCG